MYSKLLMQFRDIGRIYASKLKLWSRITVEVYSNAVLLNYIHGHHPVIIRIAISVNFNV
jgi:hypothetical protein